MTEKNFFYVVATPIGNLNDLTFRAVEILKKVDLILAEDTRVSRKLLKHFGIETKMISYNSHSSKKVREKIFSLLREKKNLALISDAGTPTISDPGVKIISEIQAEFSTELKNNLSEIVPLPGASALLAGLCVSGIPASEFVFYGFLPTKKGRESLFKEMAENNKSSVFYESPHRLLKSLTALEKICEPNRKIFVARELTKMYEEKIKGSLAEVRQFFQENQNKIRGEFVLILEKKK